MSARPASSRRFLPGSPFNKPDSEQEVERFVVDERVTHDTYGLGRVLRVEAESVVVDFGSHQVRIGSPFPKLSKL